MITRRNLLVGAIAQTVRRNLPFELWDVFTSVRFKGNPLAVFTGANGLLPDQMMAIARETNLSETTFIFRRPISEEQEKGIRTRIFTPTTEFDFAGHPTLGTAMCLWRQGTKRVVLQLNVGPVPVEFKEMPDGRLFGKMTQPRPVFAEDHDPVVIAKLLNIAPDEITAPITNVSTGRPKLIVMLKSVKALKPNWAAVTEYFARGDATRGFYFLSREVDDPAASYHARNLSERAEDPVTGSAAGSAIAYLVHNKFVPAGKQIMIEQGAEVSRRGELYVASDGASLVEVGGFAVRAWTGQLDL